MSRVVRRCPAGAPAVVETLPYDEAGRPFPTLFYCTCSSLVAAIGRLEDAGGVRAFGALATGEPRLAASLADAVRYTRRRRRELVRRCRPPMLDGGASLGTGIGGVADARRITCLHAHAAHALAGAPGLRARRMCPDRRRRAWDHDGLCASRLAADGAAPGAPPAARPPAPAPPADPAPEASP